MDDARSQRDYTVDPVDGWAHTQTVILLHGRDSSPGEFAGELFESEDTSGTALRNQLPTTRWVFPGAASRASARFQCAMRQWFDMWSVEEPDERPELQKEGLAESVQHVGAIVRRELEDGDGVPVFLGGISQGFAAAVATLLAVGSDLGGLLSGLVGFCSWMPPIAGGDGGRRVPPVFLAHSEDDEVVPIANGRSLRDALVGLSASSVEWHEYKTGGHWVNEPEGVQDMVRFLGAQDPLGTMMR